MKAQTGTEVTLYPFFNLGAKRVIGEQRQAPVSLPL